ncbi:MAG: OmpA family protein [Lewinellaceae bacterium]|nr:OmpA family protein [Lewinellaceae bacterium]
MSIAQKPTANIVPNPSFERFASAPIGWSYKGAYFGEVVKYWFSATTASPDIYGPDVHVPMDWADKGFGDQKPRTGKCMAGLTLFGCTNGKPHCREFVEIQLAEPLVIGQAYHVEFWVTHLDKSLQINNLGAYFSISEIKRQTDEVLVRDAQVSAKNIVPAPGGKWVKVSGQFVAKYEAEYVVIGNFQDDFNTLSQAPKADCFNYAYYYLDDVLVKKIPPYMPVPVKPDDLSLQKLEPGKTIQLKNIYFEFDKDELMPRSYVELNKLLKIMRENPKLSIEIVGHTDALGDDDYNLELSRRRALAVVNFLQQNKISKNRLRSHGDGEAKPIASNETDEGRAQNRRVEFVVVKK